MNGVTSIGSEGIVDGIQVVETVGTTLGFTLDPEVGIQDGTDIGASLELKVGDALSNNDG